MSPGLPRSRSISRLFCAITSSKIRFCASSACAMRRSSLDVALAIEI
jgi:hypothetical protein